MYFRNSKFLIIGLAASGLSATKLLLSLGAECSVFDEGDAPQIVKNREDLVRFGARDVANSIEVAIKECEVVVVSPGIPIDHKLCVLARRLGKRIIGELELGYLMLKAPIIAVTGTNGKTTVCSLIDAILLKASINSFLAGNIGTPLTEFAEQSDYRAVGVIEVSSFQLETIHHFCPHIAIVLNITPDHLTRHYNLNNYIYLKSRLLCNLRESEYAVLNADDKVVFNFKEKTRAKVKYFSMINEVDGSYIKNNKICYNGEEILSVDSVSPIGTHNLANVLAAVVAAKLMKVPNHIIAEAISGFKGVKHRIELVYQNEGVNYYNDSKATNIDATIKAINAVNGKTVLILGGKDKGVSFDELFKAMIDKNIHHAVLTGEARYKLLEAAERCGYSRVTVTANFDSAVKIAKLECGNNGNVLLSPACASLDSFNDYRERGDEFVKLVKLYNEVIEE